MATYLKDGRENLRGRKVRARVDGKWRPVMVITHSRGDKWIVEGEWLVTSSVCQLVGTAPHQCV